MVSAPRCRPGARGLLALLLLLPLPGARGLCGALPRLSRAIPHDTSRTEGFPVGTQVTYKCINGFVKIPGKSDTVVCLENSEWSTFGEFCNGGCGAPPRLKSATLSKEDGQKNYCPPGSTVSYVCRPGYESTEVKHVVTCLENLTWSEAPEFCRGKSCGVPKGPEHGRAVVLTNDLCGARANIICDDGFRLCGRSFIQCLLKGDQVEWSQLPTCEGIPCKQLELENGRVHLKDRLVGATANFSCDEGYRLIGPTSAQCVVAGNGVNWDKELPHCQAITCSPPPNITNGMHNGSNVEIFVYNSSVTYKCDHNFALIGEASIQCTTKDNINGVWNGSAPECKDPCRPKRRRRSDTNGKEVPDRCNYGPGICDSPPRLSFAELPGTVNDSSPVGTELKYSCRPGYVLGSGKSPLVTCLANSTWSVDPEFCVGICDSPPRLSFAELPGTVNDSSPVGTELKYSCRPGYVLGSGKSPLVTCLENSTWSVDPEFCVGRLCKQLELENGRVDLTDLRFGTIATFSCNEGYRLIGTTSAQCVVAGNGVNWDKELPRCQGIPCKQLELKNGRVHLKDRQVGATANFSCDEGYRLIGTTFAQCVAVENGVNWDKELPHCQVIITQDKPTTVPPEGAEVTGTSSGMCGALPRLSRAVPCDTNRTKGFPIGTEVTYRCLDGFVKIPGKSDTVVCLSNSEWSTFGEFCNVIITQDKPTTVPPERAEVAETSSDSALNTAGNSAEPEVEGPGIDRRTDIAGIGPGIDTYIIGIIFAVVIVILIVVLIRIGNIGILTALNKIWQKKKGSYSVNPGSPKHQITTEHDSHLNESKCNLIFKV